MGDNFIIQPYGKVKWTNLDNSPDYLINKINNGYFNTFHIDNILLNPNLNSIPSFIEGQMFYDPDWKTCAVQIDSDVTLQIGQEDVVMVYNNSGVEILDGQPVYVTGSGSDLFGGVITETVALAKADNLATSKVFGIATQHIPNNSYGFVTNRGKINGLNTMTMGNEGDVLYLSPSVAGGLTNSLPEYPNIRIPVARLLIKDDTMGRISVNIDESAFGSYTTSFSSPLYFTSVVSPISASCNTLSYTNSIGSPTLSSVSLNNNTVLIKSFIADSQLGVSTIPSGVWNFNITSYVSHGTNETRFIAEVFTFSDTNIETLLFTVYSSDINDTTLKDQLFTYAGSEYICNTTDRLLVKLYGTSTRTSPTTLYFAMGDGLSPFLTPPLKIKHSSLSNFNEDPEIQHMNSQEKTKISEIVSGNLNLTTDSSVISFGSSLETKLVRDGSHILSMRNTTNPQEFRVYGLYVNSNNYERMFFKYNPLTTTFQIGTEKGSSGGTARTLDLVTDGTVRMNVSQNGVTLPTMTSTERNSIVSPSASLTLFNSSQQKINSYNGVNTRWETAIGSTSVYEVVTLTQSEYDSISPDANKLYIITDATNPPLTIPIRNVTTNYNVVVDDGTINVTANSVTLTLPTCINIVGRVFVIKNSGVGVVTINSASGGELIDGLTTQTINSQYGVLRIQSTGTGWIIV